MSDEEHSDSEFHYILKSKKRQREKLVAVVGYYKQ